MLTSTVFSFRGLALALALTAGVTAAGNADAMSRKDKNTLVGAVVGGVAGHVLSNGDPLMTAGGAVAGGAIGNVTTKDRRDNRNHRYDRDRRYDRDHRYERSSRHDRRHDQRRWNQDRRNHNAAGADPRRVPVPGALGLRVGVWGIRRLAARARGEVTGGRTPQRLLEHGDEGRDGLVAQAFGYPLYRGAGSELPHRDQ